MSSWWCQSLGGKNSAGALPGPRRLGPPRIGVPIQGMRAHAGRARQHAPCPTAGSTSCTRAEGCKLIALLRCQSPGPSRHGPALLHVAPAGGGRGGAICSPRNVRADGGVNPRCPCLAVAAPRPPLLPVLPAADLENRGRKRGGARTHGGLRRRARVGVEFLGRPRAFGVAVAVAGWRALARSSQALVRCAVSVSAGPRSAGRPPLAVLR